eukprot:TRINITY_DN1105_c0_g5_i1.p1 TRINITY_DN1105_c0_g5~~TRINITY_DN1105_c0_g5_i1.p1  ORF type:complete len:159 (+),score=39.50 TRINITY_DN1105_c0_g5_i1:134-610(+)
MGVIGYIGQSESARRSSSPTSSVVAENSSSLHPDQHPLLAEEGGKVVISTTTAVTQVNWVRVALLTFLLVALIVIVFAIGLFLGIHVSEEKSATTKPNGGQSSAAANNYHHNTNNNNNDYKGGSKIKHFVPLEEEEPSPETYTPPSKSGVKASGGLKE